MGLILYRKMADVQSLPDYAVRGPRTAWEAHTPCISFGRTHNTCDTCGYGAAVSKRLTGPTVQHPTLYLLAAAKHPDIVWESCRTS